MVERRNPTGPDDDGLRGADVNELEVRWALAAGVVNAAAGRFVDLMADALERDLWSGHRIHSPVQWVMWRAGVGRLTARRVVLLAARAAELPATVGLLREGRLSLDQAATVARYTPAEYEASVCELAVHASVAQITAATREYRFDVEARPERPKCRAVNFGSDDDGSWWARIRLSGGEGAVFERALSATRDRLHHDERAEARQRAEADGRDPHGTDAELGVAPVGWADAAVGMAHTVLDHGCGGAGVAARPRVVLHLELPRPAKPDEPGGPDRPVAELHGGAVAPPWLRRLLTCDGDVEAVGERDGVPVTAWRTHRVPPDRLRRLVERRDRYRCRVPGCDRTRWLQVHHIVHWEDRPDGTETGNLLCLCSKHHRLHHQGLLDISGNADAPIGGPDEVNFHDPVTGRDLPSVGTPTRPGPADLPTVEPYRCPTGERLDRRHVWFGRRPDEPPP
ncbi:MAG: DUF222 domain-containing protein [Acidimicrobiales bacterium]